MHRVFQEWPQGGNEETMLRIVAFLEFCAAKTLRVKQTQTRPLVAATRPRSPRPLSEPHDSSVSGIYRT